MRSKWLRLIGSEVWEEAFLSEGLRAESVDPEMILKAALARSSVDVRADPDLDDAEDVVFQVLDALTVGHIGVEFPASMHGDAISVDVSRFPSGTAVGHLFTTYDGRRIAFVLRDATAADVEDAVFTAIDDQRDGADWNIDEEDEDGTDGQDGDGDGTPAIIVGVRSFRRAWDRTSETRTHRKRAEARPSLKLRRG